MDRLKVAKEAYERVAPVAGEVVDKTKSDQLEAWLIEYVCPVVEDLSAIGAFRQMANWPIDRLVAGAKAPERKLVEAMDRTLVEVAQTFVQVGGQPDVQMQLCRMFPTVSMKQESNVDQHDTGKSLPHHFVPALESIAEISARPWFDLVVPEEYMYPCRELNLINPKGLPLAEFDELENPHLATLGDYVSRLAVMRIDHWATLLNRFAGGCVCAITQLDRNTEADLLSVANAQSRLQRCLSDIGTLRFAGAPARTRDSSIVLTQIYAAYSPRPRLDWLLVPADIVAANRGFVRLCVRRPVCDMRVLLRVVAALDDVQELYVQEPTVVDTIAVAVDSKRLVLLERPRRAFWDGKLIKADWDGNTLIWEFLWELASNRKQLKAVDRFRLSNSKSERAIIDRRSRLSTMVPRELREKIVPAGRRTYRLELDPEDIALLLVDELDQIVDSNAHLKK